jgi:hypothetical protein
MKAKAKQKPEELSMKAADFDRIMGRALQVPHSSADPRVPPGRSKSTPRRKVPRQTAP